MAAALARHKHFTEDYRSTHSKYVVQDYSSSEVEEVRYEYKTEKNIKRVVEKKVPEKYVRESSMIRGPKFLVRLRSHTVFENTPVKLFCTVEGYPTPQVSWFKDDVLLDISSGKYFVEGSVGIHSLTILKCGIDDTAQYTAVASNSHGQASSQAAVIVKRAKEEEKPSPYSWMSYQYAILPEIKYTKINITFLETFDVTFGKEGDCVTLACKMTISPNLANLQPEAQWYRDEHLLKESKWVKMESGGGVAKLTLTHLAKDDEGLYTLRMVTKGGDAVHKAYVFVEDGPPPVPLAPGAPMDIKIHDANRDYVIVSWKPPNTTTEGPIIGYFVDRCEVGMENWMQCNDSPIKICKYPVSGLFEGHSYCFRVRAVNSHGISRPSRMSNPVAALDPTEFGRLQATKLGGKLDVVTIHDDLEAEGKAPGAPSKVYASETDRTYVVLSWTPPVYHGKAPLWYYIEKSLVGSGSWQRVNTQVPVRSPRYAVFDLAEGKEYLFRVLAANMHGISNPSEPTRPIRTQVLRGVPSAPGQVVSTRETDTSVLIQWAPPKEPNNLIGYYIDSCVKGSKNWTSANHKPLKDTRFVVHGLTTGEMYMFRVQAINELGLSDESQESAPLSVRAALKLPSSPYGVALLHCDGESMVLNWKRPLCSGGTPVTDYYIDKYNVAKREWREVNVPPLKERLYKVPKLTLGTVYQFRVYAANFIGLGEPSSPSAPFRCEAWTMPEPGPAYDLSITEIRDDSGVVEWKAPVYNGASAVTGYYVDICKEGTDTWTVANAAAVNHCYLKVKGLETGSSYVFRVRAENASGTGKTSVPSDPVYAKALSGTKEIKCGVDEKTGDVYLCFESCQITEKSQFVWKKSYQEITDFSKGISIKTSGNQSTLSFKNPDKEDVGTFSVSVTNTDGASASYKITAEELEKMMALSYDIRNPIIPLKSELAYKIMERGRVCFWLQAEGISSAVTYKFFANNKELVNSEQTKMRHDVATGIIELVLDHFTEDNEGTFSVQIQDGRAKAQSSLVLIGNAFKAALAEADYQRREYIRVKEGPHFSQFLSVHISEDASISLICKVANLKKESAFHWFKDDVEVIPDVPADLSSGVCRLPLPLFSKKDMGMHKATISDDRGKDESQVDISGKAFDNIVNELARIAGSSAGDLVIQCTAEGIMLQCHMKYYTEEMKIIWMLKDSKISSSERMRVGGTPAMASLEIVEPTERDKGVYTFQITDAEKTYTRTLELSGQVYDNAYVEFQRLKAEAYAEKNRGKVLGGLPDVVSIMEKKTLSLTCTVCGDPKPQVTWFKNDQEVEPGDQYVILLDSGKFASVTIKGVTLEDSGKFTMCVQNKYGGESVDIIVSVFKHGDKIPDIKPMAAPKRILPPTHPIVIPISSSPAPAPSKSSAPPQSTKSPSSSRFGARRK
ncbi:myomesin-2 [Electrophorus electricus]|uniref:Myomesin 2a n=1 Tax=Electrophorus electricus TaxID=8005 RepID=A0A4W4F214_ELEEL|nr:myomesin-2 [Electrophorus electricus]